jgi:hypothetical protein
MDEQVTGWRWSGCDPIGRCHQRLLLERADVVVELVECRLKQSKAKAEVLTTRSKIEQQRGERWVGEGAGGAVTRPLPGFAPSLWR